MTEREILDLQEQTGNQEYYLMLVGSFLHAYGHGVYALSRVAGYRVMRKQRKWGEVLTAGFLISRDVRYCSPEKASISAAARKL